MHQCIKARFLYKEEVWGEEFKTNAVCLCDALPEVLHLLGSPCMLHAHLGCMLMVPTHPTSQVMAPIVVVLSKAEVLGLMPRLLQLPDANLKSLYKKLATQQILAGQQGQRRDAGGGTSGCAALE